ncbi:peptidase M24, structural domain-containing protein [Zychaea mexicana]|uniref:peptidase M24, structural domain-containing protein n=1 Tax=Zychaea mexicana TaxID=64656 RepID=UPI0022FDB5C5|nr:peptidase M24, structural domain-containing protein [Zychaea mexicana]KAI9493844.1 peptidase M24, structural domain-containing protein [Zychaea mexicana]
MLQAKLTVPTITTPTRRHFLVHLKRSFHAANTLKTPPRRSATPSAGAATAATTQNRWGSFQRLAPTSLAPIDVTTLSRRPVPNTILKPYYAQDGSSSKWEHIIPLVPSDEISLLRQAGQLAREILQVGGKMCLPGVTTDEIDAVLHEKITESGAYPSPLNYSGFPKSVCTSVNNVIAHGIPDNRELQGGDIINIDVTVFLNGYHGDTSATFLVGNVDTRGRELVTCTQECLEKALAICGPGVPLSEIGQVICDHADTGGFSVSEELSGHGIGTEFHSLPLIYHHRNVEDEIMTPGMAFTIEPVLCQGSAMGIMWPDNWTISTVDGGRSAQFEHMVIITNHGVEVLTK